MLTMVFAMMELETSSAAANQDGKARHVTQKVSLHVHYIYLRPSGTILKLVGTSLLYKRGKNIYNAHLIWMLFSHGIRPFLIGGKN